MADLPVLLERIRALTDDPSNGSRRMLAEMDHALTDGYALALALEAEGWRIEKRIGELVANAHDPEQARELRRLAVARAATEDDLTRLRTLLRALQERADMLRSALSSR